MSYGGEGVLDESPELEKFKLVGRGAPFPLRRFQAGGRLTPNDVERIREINDITCVLCGASIQTQSNAEHPLPQWIFKLAGEDVSERVALGFSFTDDNGPTWRQLCLRSHERCNSEFGIKIETSARAPIKAMIEGRRVTWQEMDRVFDWLDKVKATAAHMGTALSGHRSLHHYPPHAFANTRVGRYDRIALFFRIDDAGLPLELADCIHDGFLTTPTAIILKIKSLVIVYVSSRELLSSALGLGRNIRRFGMEMYDPSNGMITNDLGDRISRIPSAKVIAQPMRRLDPARQFEDNNRTLQANGDGKVFEFKNLKWQSIKSTEFSNISQFSASEGYALASLEAIEWILLTKEQDFSRYPPENDYFMQSYDGLKLEKAKFLKLLETLGINQPPENDRIPNRLHSSFPANDGMSAFWQSAFNKLE